VYIATYTDPGEWSSISDKIELIFIDPRICGKLVELSHYLWVVESVTSVEGSGLEIHTYAVIDVNTGVFYHIGDYRVVASGATD